MGATCARSIRSAITVGWIGDSDSRAYAVVLPPSPAPIPRAERVIQAHFPQRSYAGACLAGGLEGRRSSSKILFLRSSTAMPPTSVKQKSREDKASAPLHRVRRIKEAARRRATAKARSTTRADREYARG